MQGNIDMKWRDYWTSYPAQFGKGEFARQVKYTVGGQPVPDSELRASAALVCANLELASSDTVLDLCCGNGLVTSHLAARCRDVLGVDFSSTLIGVASDAHSGPNITYLCKDVIEFLHSPEAFGRRFSKILMNGGLQYFNSKDLPLLLRGMLNVLSDSGIILLTNIPDLKRKSVFYNTPSRRLRHVWERIKGRDQMGTWWDTAMVERLCRDHHLDCQFSVTHTQIAAPYRFDVKMTPSH
jgi:cyclopropane fatty-acyl-phospholipid synthase-like methyltransferase